jgi:asparagine synthase (glutamine-hydrolysing)
MCAINGLTGRDRLLVERMNRVTAYRGPNGTGVLEDDAVTLGHNRLAIIDLSPRGAQPMKNRDGSLVITYNGELYNFRELRAELAGYPYQSDSDTEVILAAYERWGVGAFARMNGIFAFAIWDARKKELVLARDHMGIKPCYYAFRDGRLLFSSEIKALLEAGVSRAVDRASLGMFMRLTDTVGPATFFAEVKKLPAAHYGVYKAGSFTVTPYWQNAVGKTEERSAADWHAQIRAALDASVARQLISDRPLGVSLSGGIDSSAILESASRVVGGRMHTFTTRFEVDSPEEEGKFNRDAEIARKTAAHFGAEHTEITVQKADVIPLLEEGVWHMDEPTGSATMIAQLALAKRAAKDITVMLGGEGGDELFGGYERYRLARLMKWYQALPAALRGGLRGIPELAKLNTPLGVRAFALFHFIKERDSAAIYQGVPEAEILSFFEHRFFGNHREPFLDALMNADRELLADGSLIRTDKLSMAAGLEARVPLLDLEMVELAARIPGTQKLGWNSTKALFKDALRERLPAYLFEEPKRGWFAPSGYWLQRAPLLSYAKEVLREGYYASPLHWGRVHTILEEHASRTHVHRPLLWALLSFQIWAKKFEVRF